jgi:hypothetical protein
MRANTSSDGDSVPSEAGVVCYTLKDEPQPHVDLAFRSDQKPPPVTLSSEVDFRATR